MVEDLNCSPQPITDGRFSYLAKSVEPGRVAQTFCLTRLNVTAALFSP